MTGTGLKKCMPATRSGASTAAAIRVIEIEDVLLVRIASVEIILLSCLKIPSLTDSSSNAASITMDAGAAASMLICFEMADCARAASAGATFPLATSFSRLDEIVFVARSRA
jgi:hypothetical protein